MNEQRFEYYAFISYSHKDIKWAKRLQEKLEAYRLPSIVHRESGGRLPKRVRPVFLDQTDLGAGVLQQSLRRELEDSRYLIVVCSPQSAKSEWVNHEIKHFRELGRGDRIIPFIVGGTPNAPKQEEEGYPTLLRGADDELLGVSIPELGEERALVKVVAAILGLKFDQLWQRHRRRERKTAQLRLAQMLLLLGVVAAAGYSAWDYTRTKVGYFEEIGSRWGEPVGIFPLDSETVRHRQTSFRVESSRRKVRRIIRGTSSGQACDDEDNFNASVREVAYRENGEVERIDWRDHNNRIVLRQRYSERTGSQTDHYIEFRNEAGGSPYGLEETYGSKFSQGETLLTPIHSDITTHRVVYDAKGRPQKIFFLNAYHYPRSNVDGVAGRQFEYDAVGRALVVTSLDQDGRPLPDRRGVVTQRSVFNKSSSGELLKTLRFLTAQGGLTPGQEGYARKEVQYDACGNEIESRFFDADGSQTLSKEGYAKVIKQHDEHGNQTETAYYGVNGNPILCNNGYAKAKAEYDDRCNQTANTFFGLDGKPILSKFGNHKETDKYDERGNIIEASYFGLDDSPVLCNLGCAKWTAKYDERGNLKEVAYFGLDGKPVLCGDRYTTLRAKYDDRGNRIEQVYFGLDGQPTLTEDGTAGWTSKYDEHGNLSARTFLDVDRQPIRSKITYTTLTFKYDEYCKLIDMACLDHEGKTYLVHGQYGRITYKYDSQGNQIETAYYGLGVESALYTRGYAKATAKYDQRCNMIEEAYFGTDGQPVTGAIGYPKRTAKFDRRDNQVEEAYFGTDGQPVSCGAGYAKWTAKFNDRGNKIEETFFDADGKPVFSKTGYAKRTAKFDDRGNKIEETYFDAEGKPVLREGRFEKWVAKYDDQGNIIEATYFVPDGNTPQFVKKDGRTSSASRMNQTIANAPTHPETWDMTKKDFRYMNPDGAWSYGRRMLLQGDGFDLMRRFLPNDRRWVMLNTYAMGIQPRLDSGILAWAGTNMGGFPTVRWTCPKAGMYYIASTFKGSDARGVDVFAHIIMRGKSIYTGEIHGADDKVFYQGIEQIRKGDYVDFVVRWDDRTNHPMANWTTILGTITYQSEATDPLDTITSISAPNQSTPDAGGSKPAQQLATPATLMVRPLSK